MATASREYDVCDTCWGSGDSSKHGVDLRKLFNERDADVAKLALTYLADAAGVNFIASEPAVEQLILEISKLSKKREAVS